VALLAMLMLRGAQTAAELRLHCERLHRFADISAVEGFLDELAAKAPALVVKLARAPGEREARWAHVLGGEPAASSTGKAAAAVPLEAATSAVSAGEIAALKAEQARLAQQLDELRTLVLLMAGELGVDAGSAVVNPAAPATKD
jgi:uncharacterized protein YceH (UPF0502 family)